MRLIDADAFEKWLRKARENCYANEIHDCEDEGQMTNINDELYFSTQSFIDTMKYRPTIDAEPVRHAKAVFKVRRKWDGSAEGITETVPYCSDCGKRIDDLSALWCAGCGAKMDEEG